MDSPNPKAIMVVEEAPSPASPTGAKRAIVMTVRSNRGRTTVWTQTRAVDDHINNLSHMGASVFSCRGRTTLVRLWTGWKYYAWRNFTPRSYNVEHTLRYRCKLARWAHMHVRLPAPSTILEWSHARTMSKWLVEGGTETLGVWWRNTSQRASQITKSLSGRLFAILYVLLTTFLLPRASDIYYILVFLYMPRYENKTTCPYRWRETKACPKIPRLSTSWALPTGKMIPILHFQTRALTPICARRLPGDKRHDERKVRIALTFHCGSWTKIKPLRRTACSWGWIQTWTRTQKSCIFTRIIEQILRIFVWPGN